MRPIIEQQGWSLQARERRDKKKPVLEDMFMGPTASPSLSDGFGWEDSRRRARAVFADVAVADQKHVMLLLEFGRLPVFYFPVADVRINLLEPPRHRTS